MAIPTPAQTIVNTSNDSTLNKIYSGDLQSIGSTGSVGAVYISTTQEYVTNYFNNSKPGGTSGEVQFNSSNELSGDTGFTYDPITDSLSVTGNVLAGNIKTDNLLYANGDMWSISDPYGDSNVAAYLPTFTGNVAAGNIKTNHLLYANGVAWTFAGTYTNSNVAAYLPTYTGNIQGGNLTITGTSTLGGVGNVRITGGSSGQYLQTDGSGHLSWATVSTPSTPSLSDVTSVGATSSTAIHITNSNDTSSYSDTTASLSLEGGLSVRKAVHSGTHLAAEQTIYAGHLSDFSSWTYPKFIGRDAGASYIQGALINTNSEGSADWVAYGNQSDDANGWMDMGFTGTAFSDTNYTITKENDGYLICQGMPNQGGNLVLATGEKGGVTHRDIVFATGGFLINNERMRLNHEDQTLYVGAHGDGGTNVTNIDTNGNIKVGGNIVFSDSSVQSTAPRDEPKFTIKYATFAIQVGKRYLVDSLNAAAITTMPTSPSIGDAIYFTDAYGSFNTHNLTIHTSDKNIMGSSGDYVVSTAGASFGLVYNGQEWRRYT